MKKILFLTVNNLATNPRLLKEIQSAKDHFQCTVYAFRLNNASDAVDDTLVSSLSAVSFHYINAGRKPLLPWVWSTTAEKISEKIYSLFRGSLKINAYGHSKRSLLLNKALEGDRTDYDLIIAHNLAALYPAYRFSKKNNIPFAFDIEDYHPGERTDHDAANEKKRREFLMAKMLPSASYISYASPLFRKQTSALFSAPEGMPHLYIPNSFAENEFIPPAAKQARSKLRLVWFSQHINAHRGLEEIIEAAKPLRERCEIHLIGQLNTGFIDVLAGTGDFIFVHPAMKREELHRSLSGYDIGLAIEMSTADDNREIALTNKIYAYAQAGLLVLATDTKAQAWFANEYPGTCVLVGQSPAEIRQALETLISNRENIRKQAEARYAGNKILSRQKPAMQLLELWNNITNSVTANAV